MRVNFEIDIKILECDDKGNSLDTGIGTRIESMPMYTEKTLEELKEMISESIGKILFDIKYNKNE